MFSIIYFLYFIVYFGLYNAEQGPVIAWGARMKNQFPLIRLTTENAVKRFVDDLRKDNNVIFFHQLQLDVEDIHDINKTMNVGNDVAYIPNAENLKSILDDYVAGNKVDTTNKNEFSANDVFHKSRVVVYELPMQSSGQTNKQYRNQNVKLMESVMEALKMKKVVYVYFGASQTRPSNSDDIQRLSRKLLSATIDPNNATVFNMSGHMLLSMSSIKVNVSIGGEDKIHGILDVTSCEVNSTSGCSVSGTWDNSSATITIKYPELTNVTSEPITFTMNFVLRYQQWRLDDFVASMTIKGLNMTEHNMTGLLSAYSGFSYTCFNQVFKCKEGDGAVLTLLFKELQVQPFDVKDSLFSRPYDCLGVFSISIWMGLIVTILFTIILIFGSYLLMSIKTMDKFDDPKGKTISVPTAE